MKQPRPRDTRHADWARRMGGGALAGRSRSVSPISPHTRPTRRTVGVISPKPWPDIFTTPDEFEEDRLQRIDKEGNVVWTSGNMVAEDFAEPKAIEVSKQHGIVLASAIEFLTDPAGHYLVDYETGEFLWNKEDYIRTGRGNGAVRPDGNVVVGHNYDSSNAGWIDLFDQSGNLLQQWVFPDVETEIAGISADSNNNVYFSGYDSGDTRYWKLDSNLNVVWVTNNGLDRTYNAFVVHDDIPAELGYNVDGDFVVKLFDPTDGSKTKERIWTDPDGTNDFTVWPDAIADKIALASWGRNERILMMDNDLNDIWVVTGTDIMQEAYAPAFDQYGRVWVRGWDADWIAVIMAFDANNGELIHTLPWGTQSYNVSPGRYAAGLWP